MHTRTSKTKESAMSDILRFTISSTVVSTPRGKSFLIIEHDPDGTARGITVERIYAPSNMREEKVIILAFDGAILSRGRIVEPPQAYDAYFLLKKEPSDGPNAREVFYPHLDATQFEDGVAILIIPLKGATPVATFRKRVISRLLGYDFDPKDPLYEVHP